MDSSASWKEQWNPLKTYREYKSFKQCTEFIEAIQSNAHKFKERWPVFEKRTIEFFKQHPDQVILTCTSNPQKMGLDSQMEGCYLRWSDDGETLKYLVLNSNILTTEESLEEAFLHEMVHAMDDLHLSRGVEKVDTIERKDREFEENVCTEIRANYFISCFQQSTEQERRNCTLRESLKSIQKGALPQVSKQDIQTIIHYHFNDCINVPWYNEL